MSLTRVFDIIDFQIARHPSAAALNYKSDGTTWKSTSSKEIKERILQTAQGLMDYGLKKGDNIIVAPIVATPNTIFLDFAAQMLGIIPIVVHSTFTKDQVRHVIDEVNPKAAFLANEELRESFAISSLLSFVISDHTESEYQKTFLKSENIDTQYINDTAKEIQPDNLAIVIYTSGSTGVPKGVMLSHHNIISNLTAVMSLLPVGPRAITVNYLPFSHILERSSVYMAMTIGFRMHIINEVTDLPKTLLEVKPEFLTAVPRIIEKMLEGLESHLSQQGFFTKKLLRWAIDRGLKYEPYRGFKPHYALYNKLARYLILSKLRKAMGGRLKGIVVGGAHLRPQLANLLEVAGIKVREGYGMTETSPIITVNRFEPGMHKIGTVGLPVSNVEIKLDQTETEVGGEILVKGPNVTSGYYKKPDLNHELFDEDGWLKTGDIGTIDDNGFLTITDRKKDIYKTSAGKYIAPQLLENLFKSSLYINQILIIGFHRPYITAVIVPNYAALEKWSADNDVHWTSPTYMAHNIKVREKVQEDIDEVNKTLSSFKTVRNFVLLDQEWTTENGLLSASLKPMRKIIESTFKKEIDELYEKGND